jgi:hypothetical protein
MKITDSREGYNNKEHLFYAENEKRAIELFLLSEFWLLNEQEVVLNEIETIINRLYSAFLLSIDVEELSALIHDSEAIVLRVINASLNERKHQGLAELIGYLNTIYGRSIIKNAQPVRVPGEEPAVADAKAVARHKIQSLLDDFLVNEENSELFPELNGRNLIFSGDVVAVASPLTEIDGELVPDPDVVPEHLLNLSRITDAGNQVEVQSFKIYLEKLYASGPFQLTYTIANASAMLVRPMTENGDRVEIGQKINDTGIEVVIEFEALPQELIDNHFAKLRGVDLADKATLVEGGIDPGINVGLPLLDANSPFLKFIRAVSVRPLKGIAIQEEAGDDRRVELGQTVQQFDRVSVRVSDLAVDQQLLLFTSLQRWIVNGISPTAPTLVR